MKQLLIYSNVKPVTRADHGTLALKRSGKFDFARETNAVPLVISEFPRASDEYAIVFTKGAEGVVPAVILGVRDKENVFVTAEGSWDARYVPAFVRRYPFVFGSDSAGTTFTLMIDEDYEGLNKDGKGERLFDADGEQTNYLGQVLAFLKEYQAHFKRTRDFGQKLADLGLLEPVEARVPLPKDPTRTLTGFTVVNRDKLKALTGDVLESLLKRDELELIFIHLLSLRNLNRLHERLLKQEPAQVAEPAETIGEDVPVA